VKEGVNGQGFQSAVRIICSWEMKIGGTLSVQIQTPVFKNHFKKIPFDKEDPPRSRSQPKGAPTTKKTYKGDI